MRLPVLLLVLPFASSLTGCGSGLAGSLFGLDSGSDSGGATAPTVTAVTFPAPITNAGVQRYSPDTEVVLTFSEPVSVSGSPGSAFCLLEQVFVNSQLREVEVPMVVTNGSTGDPLAAGDSVETVRIKTVERLGFDRQYALTIQTDRIVADGTGLAIEGVSARPISELIVADGTWEDAGLLDFVSSTGNPVVLPNKDVMTLFYPRGGVAGPVFSSTRADVGGWGAPKLLETSPVQQDVFRGPSSVSRATGAGDWAAQMMWYDGRVFNLFESGSTNQQIADGTARPLQAILKQGHLQTRDEVEQDWSVTLPGANSAPFMTASSAPNPLANLRARSWVPKSAFTSGGVGVSTWLDWAEWRQEAGSLAGHVDGLQGLCPLNNGLLSRGQVWGSAIAQDGQTPGPVAISRESDGGYCWSPALLPAANGSMMALWYQAQTPDCVTPEDNDERADCACFAGDQARCATTGGTTDPDVVTPCSYEGAEDYFHSIFDGGSWSTPEALGADLGNPSTKDMMRFSVAASRRGTTHALEDVALLVGIPSNGCRSCGDGCVDGSPANPKCIPTVQVYRPEAGFLSTPIPLDLSLADGTSVTFFRRRFSNWPDRYGERGLRVVHLDRDRFMVLFQGWVEEPGVENDWHKMNLYSVIYDCGEGTQGPVREISSVADHYDDERFLGLNGAQLGVERVRGRYESFQPISDAQGNVVVICEMVFSAESAGMGGNPQLGAFTGQEQAQKLVGAVRYSSSLRPRDETQGRWSLGAEILGSTSFFASNPKPSEFTADGECFVSFRVVPPTASSQSEALANGGARFRGSFQ